MCHICQSSVSCSCRRLQFWQASLLCRDHVVCSFDRPVFCVVLMSLSAVLTGLSFGRAHVVGRSFDMPVFCVALMSSAVLTGQSSVSCSCCCLQFWQASLIRTVAVLTQWLIKMACATEISFEDIIFIQVFFTFNAH